MSVTIKGTRLSQAPPPKPSIMRETRCAWNVFETPPPMQEPMKIRVPSSMTGRLHAPESQRPIPFGPNLWASYKCKGDAGERTHRPQATAIGTKNQLPAPWKSEGQVANLTISVTGVKAVKEYDE